VNYELHYGKLIERARLRSRPEGYTERHHIKPRCIGGSDEADNLVELTPEEHYVAHQLLVKMNPGVIALVLAANMMAISPTNARSCNRIYGWIKRAMSEATSRRFKGRSWTSDQNQSRSRVVSAQWADDDFRAKRSAAMRGRSWTDESRAARSAAMKGKPGRVWTAEQKAKLSATKRNQHQKLNLLKGAEDNERRTEGSISGN
jgi:hypothetical protein